MLHAWEQDKLESLSKQELKTDCEELENKVYPLIIAFTEKTDYSTLCRDYIKRQIFEKRKKSSPTLLEEVLELQKVAEMYLNYIIENDPIASLINRYYKLLSSIDDVRVALQKLYKKMEQQFIEEALRV